MKQLDPNHDDALRWLKQPRRPVAPGRLQVIRGFEQNNPGRMVSIPVANLPKKQVEQGAPEWMRCLHWLGDIAERLACIVGIGTVLGVALWLAYLIW